MSETPRMDDAIRLDCVILEGKKLEVENARLTGQLAGMMTGVELLKAELESETAWAHEYHSTLEQLESQFAALKEELAGERIENKRMQRELATMTHDLKKAHEVIIAGAEMKEERDAFQKQCERQAHEANKWSKEFINCRDDLTILRKACGAARHALYVVIERMEDDGCECGVEEKGTCALCMAKAAFCNLPDTVDTVVNEQTTVSKTVPVEPKCRYRDGSPVEDDKCLHPKKPKENGMHGYCDVETCPLKTVESGEAKP